MDTKKAILSNSFLERLRTEMVVDREEYSRLCEALRELAREWRGRTLVDKEIAQDLYVLAPVAKSVADSIRAHNGDRASEIYELAVELDALVLECLST